MRGKCKLFLKIVEEPTLWLRWGSALRGRKPRFDPDAVLGRQMTYGTRFVSLRYVQDNALHVVLDIAYHYQIFFCAVKVKIKVKFALYQATKAQRGSRGLVLQFNLG